MLTHIPNRGRLVIVDICNIYNGIGRALLRFFIYRLTLVRLHKSVIKSSFRSYMRQEFFICIIFTHMLLLKQLKEFTMARKEIYTRQINTGFTTIQYNAIKRTASALGLSPSSLIRHALTSYLELDEANTHG